MSSHYHFTIHTFGCKVNTYDTGLLKGRLLKHSRGGEAPTGETARPHVHVLNTCAVTAEATKDAARLARRIKASEPLATVVVTGCGAQVDGEVYDRMPAADLVVANSHKGRLEWILDDYFKGHLKERVFRSNIFRKEDLEEGGGTDEDHTRAFLKIQDGCNSFCTYCVIPFARGKSRSLSVASLVARVRELRSNGVGEVVLTGVHIADYEDTVGGRPLALHDLVREILERTDVPRLRLTSLEPGELTPELLALFANERLCPHFHMSIQSANSRVLEAMRRRYDASAVESALFAIERNVPDAFVGMDVIAGFPGETEDEFADTYERLARLPWTRLHVFPYSERPGTKAIALANPVTKSVRTLRAQRLRELSAERFRQHAERQVGRVKRALILRGKGDSTETLTRDYWPLQLEESLPPELRGQETEIVVTGFMKSERMEGLLVGARREAFA